MRRATFRFAMCLLSASALIGFGPRGMVASADGQQPPYVPPGQFHSFDQLAGLECTSPGGAAGSLHILYLKAQVATLACATGRFIDLGRTVFDTQTRIQWERKTAANGAPNPVDLHDVDNVYTWCEAKGYSFNTCAGNTTSWIGEVNAEAFEGFTDWRLPDLNELESLRPQPFPPCQRDPCIDSAIDPTASALYWSLGTFGGFPNGGALNFTTGLPVAEYVLNPQRVRAMRGPLP